MEFGESFRFGSSPSRIPRRTDRLSRPNSTGPGSQRRAISPPRRPAAALSASNGITVSNSCQHRRPMANPTLTTAAGKAQGLQLAFARLQPRRKFTHPFGLRELKKQRYHKPPTLLISPAPADVPDPGTRSRTVSRARADNDVGGRWNSDQA